jgi:hypothetical protein
MLHGQAAHQRRGAADYGEYHRQAAGASAEGLGRGKRRDLARAGFLIGYAGCRTGLITSHARLIAERCAKVSFSLRKVGRGRTSQRRPH